MESKEDEGGRRKARRWNSMQQLEGEGGRDRREEERDGDGGRSREEEEGRRKE